MFWIYLYFWASFVIAIGAAYEGTKNQMRLTWMDLATFVLVFLLWLPIAIFLIGQSALNKLRDGSITNPFYRG